VFCNGTSTADPAVDADAPLAIAKDIPAIPNAGATLFPLFRFGLFFARAIRLLQYPLGSLFHKATSVHLTRRITNKLVSDK
jgi:hypothetical protein